MPSICIVIPRVAPRSSWADQSTPAVDLILPHDPANRGNIVYWEGCHGEASSDYYDRTHAPRTPAEVAAATALVKRYRAFMASLPEEHRQTVVERKRRPADWRRVAWGTAS